jgi:putative oxidoreductase
MTAEFVAVVVRFGLVLLFLPFSALDKILGFNHAVRQAQQMFSSRPTAVAMILIGLAVEIFCSLGVVTGIADRASAFLIAGYCAATAVLFKRFWAQGDFWSDPDGKGRSLFWDFLKNLSLGAGFLLIVVGADGSGLRPSLRTPLLQANPTEFILERSRTQAIGSLLASLRRRVRGQPPDEVRAHRVHAEGRWARRSAME